MRISVVDPSSYSRPYDHQLCDALARRGHRVELLTSRFDYTAPPTSSSYATIDHFYRWSPGLPKSRERRLAKALQHPLDMRRLRKSVDGADVVHFQWLVSPPIDRHLLPRDRPLVVTLHNVLREDILRTQTSLQRTLDRVDAIVVHTAAGRDALVDVGVPPSSVWVIPHGAFNYLASHPAPIPLPRDLAAVDRAVVLMFGALHEYKGVDTAVAAWSGVTDAELWIVGLPRIDLTAIRARAPENVRFVSRFVSDAEVAAYFDRADLVVLPYRRIDQSGVLFAALAFGKPLLLTSVGGFVEIAAAGAGELVPPDQPDALAAGVRTLLDDPVRAAELGRRASELASTTYSWDAIAGRTEALYHHLTDRPSIEAQSSVLG